MNLLLRCFILLIPLIAGCAHDTGKTDFFAANAATAPVWPAAPEIPRVRLIKVFTGAEEFIVPKGAFGKLFEVITGENPQPVGFMTPAGIVSDGERFIYVTDPSARLVHKIDFIDNEITYLTNAGPDNPLASPVGVALDSSGNCYVTDSVKARIFSYNSKGDYLGSLGEGVIDFQRPAGIAINKNDHKYVVDALLNKVFVFDQKNRFLRDFPDGDLAKELNRPTNISVDAEGQIYLTDAFNFNVKVFDANGRLVSTIGSQGDGPGSFARPKGVAVDSEAHIYTIDANFDNFQIFDKGGRLLLFVGSTGKKPGQFFMPNGIFIDREDRIYISDSYNQRLQVFQYLKEQKHN